LGGIKNSWINKKLYLPGASKILLFLNNRLKCLRCIFDHLSGQMEKLFCVSGGFGSFASENRCFEMGLKCILIHSKIFREGFF
jgi:hypothetical protein